MPTQQTLLKVAQLKVGFHTNEGCFPAIHGIDFEIARGETLALVGESGCGKSLTAAALMQLLPASATIFAGSEVWLNKENLLTYSEVQMQKIRGRHMATVFQEPMSSLNPVRTIGEQIDEVICLHRNVSLHERRVLVHDLLVAVGIPDPIQRSREYPHQLSGGLKQRVCIAIALAGQPDLLIADEPTTALDVTIQAQVLHLLKELQAKTGMAILLITHDLGVVRQVADRVAVMYAGQIVECASNDEFFKQPQHPYSKMLFSSMPNLEQREHTLATISGHVPQIHERLHGCRFAPRCPYRFEPCEQSVPDLYKLNDQHHARCYLHDNRYINLQPNRFNSQESIVALPARISAVSAEKKLPAPSNEPLIQVRDLKVYFSTRTNILQRHVKKLSAVDGINFTIHKQEIVALVGESGCGKTTTAKALLRLLPAFAGQVLFNDVNLLALNKHKLKTFRRYMQIIFQDPYAAMNPRMLIKDIVMEGLLAQNMGSAKERLRMAEEVLEQVGLSSDVLYRYPHEFSGGQKQRIEIARVLALNPELIICDEPTSALDMSIQAQILNLLKNLRAKFGLALLLITHNLAVVGYCADYVVVMYLGRIVEEGPVEAIMTKPLHPYTQSLLASVPSVATKNAEIPVVQGELPSLHTPPSGCHFHPRCPFAMDKCKQMVPSLLPITEKHKVRCVLYE